MELNEFQHRLRSLMESRGLSGVMLASIIKVPPSTINRYLNGSRIPKIDNIISLSDFFNVSIDYLLGRKAERIDAFDSKVAKIAKCYILASPRDRSVVETILSAYAVDDETKHE